MKKLLRRARSGDADAFAELFQSYAQKLWKVAYSVMRDEDLAADALQETAIKAWRAIPSFDAKSDLGTWLTRILLNTCFDELKSRKKLIPFADIAQAEQGDQRDRFVSLQSSSELSEASIVDRMDARSVLDSMGADDRLVLTLFYINDSSISDIASVLDITEGAVRTRLSRARSRFKSLYMREQIDQSIRKDGVETKPAKSDQVQQGGTCRDGARQYSAQHDEIKEVAI